MIFIGYVGSALHVYCTSLRKLQAPIETPKHLGILVAGRPQCLPTERLYLNFHDSTGHTPHTAPPGSPYPFYCIPLSHPSIKMVNFTAGLALASFFSLANGHTVPFKVTRAESFSSFFRVDFVGRRGLNHRRAASIFRRMFLPAQVIQGHPGVHSCCLPFVGPCLARRLHDAAVGEPYRIVYCRRRRTHTPLSLPAAARALARCASGT